MWKVKDLSEWCETNSGENVVQFYSLDENGDEIFFDEDNVLLTTRLPKRTDFTHTECSYCEKTEFKGVKRLFCNYHEDIILKRDIWSCPHFEHCNEYLNLHYLEKI